MHFDTSRWAIKVQANKRCDWVRTGAFCGGLMPKTTLSLIMIFGKFTVVSHEYECNPDAH